MERAVVTFAPMKLSVVLKTKKVVPVTSNMIETLNVQTERAQRRLQTIEQIQPYETPFSPLSYKMLSVWCDFHHDFHHLPNEVKRF